MAKTKRPSKLYTDHKLHMFTLQSICHHTILSSSIFLGHCVRQDVQFPFTYSHLFGHFFSGEDVEMFKENIHNSQTFHVTFNGLSLNVGRRYFSGVRAMNKAGLYTMHSSDGFVLDTIEPETGIVYDGTGM